MPTVYNLGPIVLATEKHLSAGVKWGNEGGSQSYKAGAVLIKSGGLLVTAAAAAVDIIGVALAAASGIAQSPVPFLMPSETDEFEITLTTSAFAYVLTGLEAFTRYGLGLDAATKFWYADQANTTNDAVIVTGLSGKVGDTNPRVRVKFLPSVIMAR
jgi:hypothetical protein